ncbi:MAG: hypothetical protein Kow00108_00510 [Calditrichia bacterium]
MNNFWPIIDNWESYFSDFHEGLGTTYERLLLHRIFEKIKNNFSIKSVLEAPSFGMTGISGINSAWWYYEKNIVPVVLDDNAKRVELIKKFLSNVRLNLELQYNSDWANLPYQSNSFDLVWNFASLWFVPKPVELIKELMRVNSNILLISLPNRKNIGYQLRKLVFNNHYKMFANNPLISFNEVCGLLRQNNYKIIETGYFDCPPWPDFPIQKEKLLPFIFRKNKNNNQKMNDQERVFFLDFWELNNEKINDIVEKYNILEKNIPVLREIWSHHQYVIGKKDVNN